MIYQEEQEIQEKQPENASFATIAQVYEDGVTLLFGKEDAPAKKIPGQQLCRFSRRGQSVFGQRQRYLCSAVPNWNAKGELSGGHGSPSRYGQHCRDGGKGKFRRLRHKRSKCRTRRRGGYSGSFDGCAHDQPDGDVTASGSFSGASNLSMAATGIKAGAVKDQSSPSSRTVQFRVASAGKLQFKSSYYNSGSWYNMDGTQA